MCVDICGNMAMAVISAKVISQFLLFANSFLLLSTLHRRKSVMPRYLWRRCVSAIVNLCIIKFKSGQFLLVSTCIDCQNFFELPLQKLNLHLIQLCAFLNLIIFFKMLHLFFSAVRECWHFIVWNSSARHPSDLVDCNFAFQLCCT